MRISPRRFAAASFLLGSILLVSFPAASTARLVVSLPLDVPSYSVDPYYTDERLAVLEDGWFAISRLSDQGLELLFFTPEGSLTRTRVIPLPPGTTAPLVGGIGAFGDRYFFNWSRLPGGKAHAAFYSREGERLGRAFAWPYSTSPVPFAHHRYAPGRTGRILPFFFFESGSDLFGQPVYSQRSQMFGPGGFWGPPVDLVLPRHQLQVFDAAINEDGRFAVLFRRCRKNFIFERDCKMGVQLFDGAWRPRGPLRTDVLPKLAGRVLAFSVAMARSGVHAVSWVKELGHPPSNLNDQLLIQLFRPDGEPAGEEIQISAEGEGLLGWTQPRATFANTFVVAWRSSPD
ncbi:MAG TPA: hypothetical protein DD490_03240, partial [Acidobacteria bacterium]|nr:hypothetical protein [Acidobacteriota bacterium]